MSKGRPSFTDEDRFRIRTAKVELAIALEEWMNAGAPAEKVVDAVEELMLAVKILRPDAKAVKAELEEAGDVLAHCLLFRDHKPELEAWWKLRGGQCTVCQDPHE